MLSQLLIHCFSGSRMGLIWKVEMGSSCFLDKEHFEAKKVACAIFVKLAAAYDTLWHNGLTCKLLRLLTNKQMVQMIIKFTETKLLHATCDSTQSKICHLKNCIF